MAKFCHNMVRDIAKEMAGTFYEAAASNNDFYKHYPSQRQFILREWGRFVPCARQALGSMLGSSRYSDFVKEQIFEALCLDRGLPKGDHSIAGMSPQYTN